ncbi:MAG: hypothetical protein K9H16_04260 [Bacteroidales bacterium]|nr:hypothetical protein [Bacteroidales bacterium]
MRKTSIVLLLTMLVGILAVQPISAQSKFLKKLKDKTEDKAIEKVFGKDAGKENPGNTNTGINGRDNSNSNSPSNTRGEGLTTTPPDVLANISEAEKSFDAKQYADARFAVRQAILGIELEMGNNVLESLPEKINGLPMVKDEDLVASTGIGFVGLIIERVYREDDKQFKVTIGNDAAMLTAANMYLASGAYASTSDQDYKNVTLGGHRGIIEYDEYSGYKLSVPIGQTSVLVTEGINFENEAEMMEASENIDIENIKKELGE